MTAALLLTFGFVPWAGQTPKYEVVRPNWVTTNWTAKDPFEGAWKPYAAALAKNRGYVENSGWPEKARVAIEALGKKPTAEALYKAAASYLVAVDLDWRFEVDPMRHNLTQRANSSVLWGKLFRAWIEFPDNPKSAEFSRVGFAVCSPSYGPPLDAGEMPKALLKKYPGDRLVVSALVWYSRTGNRPLTWEWRSWVVDEAKRLPGFPDCRPQDYLTLATAYEGRHWVKDTLGDALAYRSNLREFMKNVPAAYAHKFDKALSSVEGHIKALGGH